MKIFTLSTFISILFLPSFTVDAAKLRIVPRSKALMQHKIAANFPFDPLIQVEVVDENLRRIETGSLSSLNVSTILTNTSGCQSVDASFQLHSGIGTFPGSICSPIASIAMNFTGTWNGTTLWSDATPNFQVTGEIHIAHFRVQQPEHFDDLNMFIFGAVADINEGKTQLDSNQQPLLPDRVIYIRNYAHGGTVDGAVDSYLEMKRNNELDPASKAHAVLGFGSNKASQMLLPIAMLDDFSVLSYANDSLAKFSNKLKYPFFNRLVFDENSKYHGFVLYLVERKWTDIILIQSADLLLPKEFFNMCDAYKVNILYQVTFPVISDYNSEPAGRFKDHFAKIRTIGSRIIVTAAKKPTSYYMFSEALSQNVTSKFSYQWVGFETEDDFPHGNEPTRCQNLGNLCNFAFKGTTFVSPFHLINSYSKTQWSKIWKRYLDVDQSQERDIATKLWKYGSSYALAYDSVQLYAVAFKELMKANKTITGPLLSSTIRTIQLEGGLLENTSLSFSGDSSRFSARLSLVWPNEKVWKNFFSLKVQAGVLNHWDWSLARKYSNPTNGYFIVESLQANSTVEIKSDGGSNMLYMVDWMEDTKLKTGYIDVNSKYKNLRRYRSANGLFWLDEQKLVTENLSFENRDLRQGVSYQEIERTEYVPAPFYCENGCGGNKTNPENIQLYEHGTCSKQNTCTCLLDTYGNQLWTGGECQIPMCNQGCINGNCTRPNTCECFVGWSGSDCQTPICNHSCDTTGGICILPNKCICKSKFYGRSCSQKCTCMNGKCRNGQDEDGTCVTCDSGYFGQNCDISLYAVIFPVMLGAALFFILILSAIKCFVRRAQLITELQSNNWIVIWSDVKRSADKAEKNMFLTRAHLDSENRQKKTNIGTWQRIEVYYQRFDRPSLQLTESLRYEIKTIREMKHKNIIEFVGACLEYPNVVVLTELAAKGSLDGVLSNDDISMPWIFKYSLMKDICRGLEYIHQSEIGSHGRLKSSNCLIDSRWTLKLSGFGLTSFREDQENVEKFIPGQDMPEHSGEQAEHDFFGLFWTAPEILKTGVYHIDHVGCGTAEGDVFSFAIIFSEICNRGLPFSNLSLSNSEIIDLISGRGDAYLQRIWNTYLASRNMEAGRPVRPCIPDSNWPTEKEQSKPLRLLIKRCWIKDPSLRPLPRDVLRNLEKIDPNHGENVEKLVSMLEKYSNNLEDVVTARAQALAMEKRKTEELVARLLPRPIVDDLKLGKPVEAEKFECVTICYSDIYDFSAIANASTPAQIITLVNQIYGSFDSVLMTFDAFKIETIGNNYMVVSGLPVRNGKKHASEISMFSLSLIEAVRNFRIQHLPDTQLQLRIGIHSGGVAAGVVGLKMPRYCVFGEAVDIASAMEASGEPMKIHVSEETVSLVENKNTFKFVYNRLHELKGRGVIKTWWLIDEKEAEGFYPKEQKISGREN